MSERKMVYLDDAIRVLMDAARKIPTIAIRVKDALEKLPPAQPEWDEMMVICDCCGHAIMVKRVNMEVKHDYDYERASDMRDYCERYEPTYNPEDGSM